MDATSGKSTTVSTRSANPAPAGNTKSPSPASSPSPGTSSGAIATPLSKPDKITVSSEAREIEPDSSSRVSNILGALAADEPAAEPTANPNQAAIDAIDRVTDQDHEFWGGQTTTPNGAPITPGFRETDESHYQTVGEYWNGTILEGTDGRDTEHPWSAAYISSVHERAGVTNFEPSVRHSTYINDAIEARKAEDTSAPYWGYRPTGRAPQEGDMVCWNRSGSSATFDDQQGGQYKSHCDIVKSVEDGLITTIGGNVGDSVSTRQFSIDENGLLNDPSQNWLAVLAPQNLEMS